MSLPLRKPRELYSQSFLDRCIDLFMGFSAGHLGSEMYVEHDGTRSIADVDGRVRFEDMSGVATWEAHALTGSIPRLSDNLIAGCSSRLSKVIGAGVPIVEFGPGSMKNARHLIKGLSSTTYIPIDYSEGILSHATDLGTEFPDCSIRPQVVDFFDETVELDIDAPALGALLGLTITNLPGPVPDKPPAQQLTSTLKKLTKPLSALGGYFLVSTHNELEGSVNEARYNEAPHKAFGINFLYRMHQELPLDGFDPSGFEYVPVWHDRCSLLAHTVRATRSQTFEITTDRKLIIDVKSGDFFHYNNSYKFPREFFTRCAEQAGLKLVEKWFGEGNMDLSLFGIGHG